MNDDKDMPLNPVGDDALEARIVAWVLGEASSFEAEELERLCTADPALRLFERRMRVLHGLVAADVKIGTDADWKLPEGKRSKISDLLGVDPVAVVDEVQQARTADRSGRRLLLALAACAVISLVAWSMISLIGGVGEKAVAFRGKESVDFLPGGGAGGAGGGSGSGVGMSSQKPGGRVSDLGASSSEIRTATAAAESRGRGRESIEQLSEAQVTEKAEFMRRQLSEPSVADSKKQALLSEYKRLEQARSRFAEEDQLALSDAPADPMSRAKQESKEAADLRSLAVYEPESPAAPPAPPAMPAQRPQLGLQFHSALQDSEDLLAKRHEGGDAFGGAAAAGTAGDVDQVGFSLSDIIADNGIGDGTIHRNNIDAILENPNRLAGPKSAEDLAIPGIATGWKTLDEATKSKIEIFTASPSGAAVADGFYAGGDMDADRSANAVTGAFKNNLGKDLKPSEARAKSESFAFDNLGQMGELAQKLPADQSGSGRQLSVGGVLHYENSLGSTVDGIDDLSDLARRDQEVQGGTGHRFSTAAEFGSRLGEMPSLRDTSTGAASLGQEGVKHFFGEAMSGAGTNVTDIVTAGNRSGDGAINRNNIDAVLNNPNRTDQSAASAPEVAALTGLFSDGQVPLAKESKESATGTGLADVPATIGERANLPLKWTSGANLTWDDKADSKHREESLDDPIRTNPALTSEHTGKVNEIRKNLYTAEGHFNLGKYDDANRAYEDVLRTDPYNKAARRGMEQVAQARADYYRASYDQTRAQLLADVDKAWETSVPPLASEDKTTPLASMVDKRKSIIVPEIDLKNATVGEAVDLLQIRAVELDVAELDPAKKGFKFSLEKPAQGSDQADVAALRIPELKLENVALGDAIKQVADAAGIEYAYNEAGVILKPGAKTPKKSAVTLDAMAEVATAAEPFSTFSLHVSDASFKLAKAAMDRGEIPAADSIRPEEFYNAFDYGDPSPANGEPVVCAVEQSAHPAFPQRNLLRVGIKTGSQGRGQATPLNLTLLLDNSGSMEREDRNAGLANAVQQLSSLLKEGDTITVAGFSRQPRLLADRLPGARAQELNGLIAQTPSEGGTNLEEGLKLSEELAKRQFNPAAQNRIVLFTDGAANLGDARPEALQARVEGLRQQGIAFDAAGFGAEGLNDKLLERLTRNGNGRYYIVDRAEDADANFAKQLAGAFRPAAENVKVQVRFNPARVAKYKLIGFEEHRLKKEDFRNDAVDAAEMAAEEAGNALYQIEVLPQGEGEVGEVSVRFRDAASGQMVERTWTIPYESQAPAFDQAKPAIQLAGLAAFAAEKLRGAPMADALDLQQLAPVLAKVKARYANSQPVADLESMLGKLK